MSNDEKLRAAARSVCTLLKDWNRRVVFAESCTGGLISALLTEIPGVSDVHCGSLVVYRYDSKVNWLQVDRELLETCGAVNAEVARQMAAGALRCTPEADFAVSITGHLGPNAPAEQDGLVFLGLAARDGEIVVRELRTAADITAKERNDVELRLARRAEAALGALELLQSKLEA